MLLNETSSITFVVLGQMKEVIQIILAMIVFQENVTKRGILGIAYFSFILHKKICTTIRTDNEKNLITKINPICQKSFVQV